MTTDTTTVFAPITKADKQPDGTLIVRGVATDPSLDLDQQVCDPDWLKTAMPEWFQFGNIREQHSHVAAGVATEHTVVGDEHQIAAHIVDPGSVKKIEADVLKGFSVGIANPRVVKDEAAPGGRIVGGKIVEVSLVDRPANPKCLLTLAKAATPGESVAPDDFDAERALVKVAQSVIEPTDPPAAEPAATLTKVAEAVAQIDADDAAAEKAAKKAAKEQRKAHKAAKAAAAAAPNSTDEAIDLLTSAVTKLSKRIKRMEDQRNGEGDFTALTQKVSDMEETLTKVSKAASPGAVRVAPKIGKAAGATDRDTYLAKAAEYRNKANEQRSLDRDLADGYDRLAAEAQAQAEALA